MNECPATHTARSAMNERAARQPGRQPALLISRLAMCKPGASSQPAAADLPDSPSNTDPAAMHGHLIVDILTLAFVVVAVTLFLIIKALLRRRAAAARAVAEAAAAEAAARAFKSEGTMTDSDLFNVDETLNRVHNELASHQSRLDSIEQLATWRLEMVNFNRILSLLPRPVLPSQENNDSPWDFQEPADHLENTTGEEDGFEYPTV